MSQVRAQHPNAPLTPEGRRRMVTVSSARLDNRSDSGAVPGRRENRPQVARPVHRRG